MNQKTSLLLAALIVLGSVVFLVYSNYYGGNTEFVAPDTSANLGKKDFNPLDTTYNIEDGAITLIDGKMEKEIASGSASKIKTEVWGKPVEADLTDDGVIDAALILTYSAGGSGTFYYIAASLHNFESKITNGTNGILLGDRIAVKNLSVNGRDIAVEYMAREKDQPMVVPPSISITRHFRVNDLKLVETTTEEKIKEQGCLISGGEIKESLCCNSASDFPDSCLIGACGCSPDSSRQTKVCDCGVDQCFDGNECVDIKK